MKNSTIISGLVLAVFLFCAMDVSAQSKKEAKGDRLMERFAFLAATEVLKKALEDEEGENDRIKKKVAECYRMLNDPENTALWYQDIIDNDKVIDSDDKFYYAQALSSIGDYSKAKEWFEIYSKEAPTDDRSKKYAAHIDNLNHLYKDSSRFHFEPVNFNSETADFSPAYYKDGLVFVSGRSERSKEFKWDESSFLDLYQCVKDPTGNYSEPTVFNKKLNTRYHEGPVSFFTNGTSLVFTRNNFEDGNVRKSSNGVTKLKLYFTVIDEKGNWSKSDPFQYNSDEYSVGHPSIAEDGLTMYFISDMPGGYGGTDIYVSKFNGRLWSVPENLGSEVNTKGNEMFPFLHNNDVLYFASNGHGGLGGLDIVKYDFSSGGVSNIGYPLNSEKDDFGLILNPEGTQGFMASNRNSQNGMDNIYSFKFLPTANIYYANGQWEICDQGVIELLAYSGPKLVITKNICDKGPAKLDELIKLLDEDASLGIALSSHGDSEDDDVYNLSLSEKRARAATEYLIAQGVSASRILSSYGPTAHVNEELNDDKTEEEDLANGRTEFRVLKYNLESDLSNNQNKDKLFSQNLDSSIGISTISTIK